MTVLMRDANTVLVDDQPFSLVDAVLNNRDRAGEIHDAFTAWIAAEASRWQALLQAETDRADQADLAREEAIRSADQKLGKLHDDYSGHLDHMKGELQSERDRLIREMTAANDAVRDSQQRASEAIAAVEQASKARYDEFAAQVQGLVEKHAAERKQFADYMQEQDGQVALANERAEKAAKMQALHWSLCTEMMNGSGEAAVAVLREIERLKALAEHAAISAKVAELGQ